MIHRAAIAAWVTALAVSASAYAQTSLMQQGGTCGCTPELSDPSVSPLSQPGAVLDVQPYEVRRNDGKHVRTQLQGAVIEYRAEPGVTPELLQRSLEQHRAYLTSTGPATTAHSSPLAVEKAKTEVTSAGDRYVVTISSRDRDDAKQILERAQALVPQPPPSNP